ncbi:hypothetical protein PDIG_55090 [Penicillium digitatum PHI26]|uniref:Uncharacterized protein n=2 Tax=Penicillium digitatum TaxID=36651 RepID=K9GBI0_PEND2|nr:hypothetical protein PDIP_50300 [Penicillium digitatum Pd1]EKV10671.1 hypothetical protein PDIG_55090 [Penicillium digitatum PHI26]EKV13081.1 hypothetical protein PDIP_50300 [Penicillium digitatum Pd1]KAG0155792.1 hypothetical protein PDIDSM_2965 [Penicillium digitatum]
MSTNYYWQAVHPVYGVPISVVQATEQPVIRCDVRQRHNLPSRSWAVRISTWTNTNYFLWSLCAGLAGYRSDEEWTNIFETHYRKTWDEIQARVQESDGPYRFGVPIPMPPVTQAVVIHHPESGPAKTFTVRPETRPSYLVPWVTSMSSHAVWGLLRFVTERQSPVPDLFDVVIDTSPLGHSRPVGTRTDQRLSGKSVSDGESKEDVVDTFYQFGN